MRSSLKSKLVVYNKECDFWYIYTCISHTGLQRRCPFDGYFRCKVTGRCISPANRCDGTDNCGDGSDEENCCMK